MNTRLFSITAAAMLAAASTRYATAQPFDLSWSTIDSGGTTFSTGDAFELGGTIGQCDAGPGAPGMSGGNFELTGGFWPASSAGAGVPAATLSAAVSRRLNPAGPGGFCDLDVSGGASDPRQGGISELRLSFDVAPGSGGSSPVTIEQATCTAPAFVPYAGASVVSSSAQGNDLVITFTPALENARTYRVTLGSEVTSIAGQFIEVSGLVGDVNSDRRVNATDRSVVVGAWTGPGFTCTTDASADGRTNATDRSVVVGAWTGPQNCAP